MAALTPLLSCLACADMTPVVLSPQFTPAGGSSRPPVENTRMRQGATAPCRVYLADIHDLRSDPQAFGSVGSRPVRVTDAIAWVRSGFQSLTRYPPIRFVEGDAAGGPDLSLRVELINAYVMSVTRSTRAASVVLRVRYEREGAYRGTHDGLNWLGAEEAQSSFNTALAQILGTVAGDVLARCSASLGASTN